MAVLFGLGLIPMVLGVGVAVDYGRALMVRERMQGALDAATLGVGSWPGLSEAQMQSKAQEYFNANFKPSNSAASNSIGHCFPFASIDQWQLDHSKRFSVGADDIHESCKH